MTQFTETSASSSHHQHVTRADVIQGKRVLLFTKTSKVRHKSINSAVQAFKQMAAKHAFVVDTTQQASDFNPQNLNTYDAVVFISTTGVLLNQQQRQAFKQYIQQGGGFMGIHGSSWCELDWPWFVKLVGGTFASHPKIQAAKLINLQPNGLAFNHLPATFQLTDEWYNFTNLNPDRTDILLLDETSYQGGKHGNYHPIAWYQHYDGGKSFYTALGHSGSSYFEPLMQTHLLDGLSFLVSD
ncbi:ThuA domain-containing protein [Saccharobesus litoralis]|uniref:ThuA domain-containing protein n=1 Tax=Saccharobesus litoralis TaxID=2172099 RepID=A0A2S0VXM1_9ALTE|nr:ThuA domain-containing protein [Saccharobesus litoralis]AWB68925.1 ThuA domain-containing protein [Saccharobesus litoralis]